MSALPPLLGLRASEILPVTLGPAQTAQPAAPIPLPQGGDSQRRRSHAVSWRPLGLISHRVSAHDLSKARAASLTAPRVGDITGVLCRVGGL